MDDLVHVLTKFHREVFLPDFERKQRGGPLMVTERGKPLMVKASAAR